jgi:hypothetical protein
MANVCHPCLSYLDDEYELTNVIVKYYLTSRLLVRLFRQCQKCLVINNYVYFISERRIQAKDNNLIYVI